MSEVGEVGAVVAWILSQAIGVVLGLVAGAFFTPRFIVFSARQCEMGRWWRVSYALILPRRRLLVIWGEPEGKHQHGTDNFRWLPNGIHCIVRQGE